MKTISGALLLLLATRADASSCYAGVYFPDGSGHGRGGSASMTTRFSSGNGYVELDKYRFVINSTTHGESEILTVETTKPNLRHLLKEQSNISGNAANPIWEIELMDGQNIISISCR